MTDNISMAADGAAKRRGVAWGWVWAAAALTVVGGVVRWLGTRNGLWLDELFSLQIARWVGSWSEIFTRVHSDNNHYLNSLWMYWVRGSEDAGVLRGFALMCGVLTIPAAWWVGAQRGRAMAAVFLGMVACSYPLIHFSSEARGYAGAVLGTVVATGALMRFLRKPLWWVAVVYGVGICFALLSHLTALMVWAGLVAGSAAVMVRQRAKLGAWLWWVGMNAAPAALMGWLYVVDLRQMAAMGGPTMSTWWGMTRIVGLSMGWGAVWAGAVEVVVAAGFLGWAMARWWKRADGLWGVVGGVMLVMVGSASFLKPTYFLPRYYLVFVPFVYLAVAAGLVRMMEVRRGVWVAGVLLGLFVVGQGVLVARFLEVGRGDVLGALNWMAERTPGPFVNLASSQDLRGVMEVRFFGPKVKGKRVLYLVSGDSGWVMPDWYVVHTEGYEPEGPATIEVRGQGKWERAAYFGASELSGQAWTVYRRAGPGTL